MAQNDRISGYLDVKISSKSRRGFTPWKAWQKQWCELRRLDSIENGVELKLKSSEDGSILNCVLLPRSSTICRTESRTKSYAFGVFNLGRNKKPILFLSGGSETDSQEWMFSIRKMLSIASYIPVGESNFRVSLVDNNHSRSAGLLGTFGVLGINNQELVLSDPCTGEPKITWKWFQFHQFHLQAPALPVDDKKILVMHTSGDFPSGPGQLYLYCKRSSRLLHFLVARGQLQNESSPGLICKRLSRSEGDLCGGGGMNGGATNGCTPDSPLCFRSQAGSEDSGVRVSIASDDSEYTIKSKNASSLASIGMAIVTKTPGGSETEDSSQDLTEISESSRRDTCLPRNESGVSLASGIYEEIPEDEDDVIDQSIKNAEKHTSHVYENPLDLILECRRKDLFKPPPLPPRRLSESEAKKSVDEDNIDMPSTSSSSFFKQRCNTLPAKDLSKISQMFSTESEYVVMSPTKVIIEQKTTTSTSSSTVESFYMPMSPINHIKTKLESCYMSIGCKKT